MDEQYKIDSDKLNNKIDKQFEKYDQVEKDVISYGIKLDYIQQDIKKIRLDAKDSLEEIWIGIDNMRKMYIGLILTASTGIIGALFAIILVIIK